MRTYDKIDTLFNRDKETFTVIQGDYRRPEFALIDAWRVTEKIDGTNIRLIFMMDVLPDSSNEPFVSSEVRGKTDRAQLPGPLSVVLEKLRERIAPEVFEIMKEHGLDTYTLYGEGYGPGIQSGGYYRDDPAFILFDIKAGDLWLDENTVAETALRLELDRVPDLENPYDQSMGMLWKTQQIVDYVANGECVTTFAKDEKEAEGVIAKAPVPLYNSRGQRVMFKLKGSDFRAGKR